MMQSPPKHLALTCWSTGWITGLILLLTACASGPVPPDWQSNSLGSLKGFTSAYLAGNSKVAEFEFTRAKGDIASTGRIDLIARAELIRCAVRVASLEFDDCQGARETAADAAAPERAYANYLSPQRPALDASQVALLPEQHRPVAAARDDGARIASLSQIKDPLARLVAAGVLFERGQLAPASVDLAVNTASDQGWRRPLLAWLGVQVKLLGAAGDTAGKAQVQRRIDLVLSNAATAATPAIVSVPVAVPIPALTPASVLPSVPTPATAPASAAQRP